MLCCALSFRSHLSQSFVGDVFEQLPSLFTDSDDVKDDTVRVCGPASQPLSNPQLLPNTRARRSLSFVTKLRPMWFQFAVLPYTRVPRHLAPISGKCLSHIFLPRFRRRPAYRVETYQMTVSPRPKSSVRAHADRKLRPIANFVSTTELKYTVV